MVLDLEMILLQKITNLKYHWLFIIISKITMFPYSEQVQDLKLYGTSVGDDLKAKLTNTRTKWFL